MADENTRKTKMRNTALFVIIVLLFGGMWCLHESVGKMTAALTASASNLPQKGEYEDEFGSVSTGIDGVTAAINNLTKAVTSLSAKLTHPQKNECTVADATIASNKAEAKRKAEAEAKQKAEAEVKRKAEAKAEEKRKADAKAEAKRKAEAEANQKAEAEVPAVAELPRVVEVACAEDKSWLRVESNSDLMVVGLNSTFYSPSSAELPWTIHRDSLKRLVHNGDFESEPIYQTCKPSAQPLNEVCINPWVRISSTILMDSDEDGFIEDFKGAELAIQGGRVVHDVLAGFAKNKSVSVPKLSTRRIVQKTNGEWCAIIPVS